LPVVSFSNSPDDIWLVIEFKVMLVFWDNKRRENMQDEEFFYLKTSLWKNMC
jgi:hypothetical protein